MADLTGRLEEMARQILDALPGKVKEASLKDAAAMLGVLVEKLQQLREAPDERDETVKLTDDERCARVVALLERGRARGDGSAADGG